MTDELKPVRCGCGGEAEVIKHTFHNLSPSYGVECTNCHAESWQFYNTEAEAITAWNRAMGATDIHVGDKERTAKVEKRFMLVTGGMGDTLPLCECGFIVSDKWTYCPSCGARLEWNK